MIKVIVNDVSLDLKSDAVIALTRKVADIGTLQSRFSSFTNKFQVKGTKKNRDALGIKQYQDTSDSISAGIATPYQELTGKLISNGIEIATNVAVIIESVAEDITLTIRAGNGSLFDKLNRTKLSALDYSDVYLTLSNRWNSTNVFAYRNHDWTQSIVYPIHDTGIQSTQNSTVIPEGILPFYYVKDVYQRIAALFGYSWTGSTFTSDFFQRLMLPAARLDITNEFASLYGAEISLDFIRFSVGLYPTIEHIFNESIINDPYSLVVTRLSPAYIFQCYAPPFVGNYKLELTYDFNTRWANNGEPTTIRIFIRKIDRFSANTVGNVGARIAVKEFLNVTTTTLTNFTGTTTIDFACDVSDANIQTNQFVYHVTIQTVNAPVFTWNSGSWKIVSVNAEQTTFNRFLEWENHLPDITVGKFIKEVGNIFGAVYDVDEFRKEIEITRLDEIATNRDEAVDWSDKLDLSNPHEVTYIVDGIGKTTSWQWKKTDAYTFSVSVINEQLPENENYVKSDAEYSEQRSILLMTEPSMFIPVWDESARKINFNGDLRFAVARNGSDEINFSGALTTNYKVAYFDYDNSPYSLDWSRLYSEYYQGLFEPMTWYMNKVVADFKLNDLDIQSFKFKYPVYIKHFNRYFYVNEISEYTGKDQSTKCTLIAI